MYSNRIDMHIKKEAFQKLFCRAFTYLIRYILIYNDIPRAFLANDSSSAEICWFKR